MNDRQDQFLVAAYEQSGKGEHPFNHRKVGAELRLSKRDSDEIFKSLSASGMVRRKWFNSVFEQPGSAQAQRAIATKAFNDLPDLRDLEKRDPAAFHRILAYLSANTTKDAVDKKAVILDMRGKQLPANILDVDFREVANPLILNGTLKVINAKFSPSPPALPRTDGINATPLGLRKNTDEMEEKRKWWKRAGKWMLSHFSEVPSQGRKYLAIAVWMGVAVVIVVLGNWLLHWGVPIGPILRKAWPW
jgi:hypothetical protein